MLRESAEWHGSAESWVPYYPLFTCDARTRRCLMVATGFYEWQVQGTMKQPMWIGLKSQRPFAFAGLWEQWQPPEGETIESCTILTTEPNEFMRPIHRRMPARRAGLARGAGLARLAGRSGLSRLSGLFGLSCLWGNGREERDIAGLARRGAGLSGWPDRITKDTRETR